MKEQREFLINNFFGDNESPEVKWYEYEGPVSEWKVLPITDELGRQALMAIRLSMTGKIDSFSLPVDESELAGYVAADARTPFQNISQDVQFQVESGLYLVVDDEHVSLLDELVSCVMLENEINSI